MSSLVDFESSSEPLSTNFESSPMFDVLGDRFALGVREVVVVSRLFMLFIIELLLLR